MPDAASMSVPAPTRHWVDTVPAAAALADRLAGRETSWGIDIENTLTGLHHCEVALCQLSDGVEAWLVDTRAVDFAPVLRALYLPGKPPVVVHDGSGDFIVLKRIFGLVPSNVVDTLLVAQQTGFPTPNLRDLAEHYLGMRLSKRAQHSNWLARPLSDEQLRYAALDAFVLPPLATKLLAEVNAAGKGGALASATATLLESVREYETPDRHPVMAGFIQNCRDRGARARLEHLLDWRTIEGNRGDIEVLMNLSNKQLMAIARANPESPEALRRIVRLPPRMVQRHEKAILRSCAEGTAAAAARGTDRGRGRPTPRPKSEPES